MKKVILAIALLAGLGFPVQAAEGDIREEIEKDFEQIAEHCAGVLEHVCQRLCVLQGKKFGGGVTLDVKEGSMTCDCRNSSPRRSS